MRWWIVLIIFILIGLLGYGGYYWYKNKKSVSTSLLGSDLKFDQPSSNADISNDPYGPF